MGKYELWLQQRCSCRRFMLILAADIVFWRSAISFPLILFPNFQVTCCISFQTLPCFMEFAQTLATWTASGVRWLGMGFLLTLLFQNSFPHTNSFSETLVEHNVFSASSERKMEPPKRRITQYAFTYPWSPGSPICLSFRNGPKRRIRSSSSKSRRT